MAPRVVNTYGNRTQRRKKPWEKINRVLKEIDHSHKNTSVFDALFTQNIKKIKEVKTSVIAKETGFPHTKRTSRKSLSRNFSQRQLYVGTNTTEYIAIKEQIENHLSISPDISYDTTFDRLRKAEPLQKLQPITQCTSCGSSEPSQVESSYNCSLFAVSRVKSAAQKASSEKSNILEFKNSGNTDFHLTSTPKGVNIKNLHSPALSPIPSVTFEEPKVFHIDVKDIHVVAHSNGKKANLNSTSLQPSNHPPNKQNESASPSLSPIIKSTSVEVAEISKNSCEELGHRNCARNLVPYEKNALLERIIDAKDHGVPIKKQSIILNESPFVSSDIEANRGEVKLYKLNKSRIFLSKKYSVNDIVDSEDLTVAPFVGATGSQISRITCESDSFNDRVKGNSLFSCLKRFNDTQNIEVHSVGTISTYMMTNRHLYRGGELSENVSEPWLFGSADLFVDSSDSETSSRNDGQQADRHTSGTLSVPSSCASPDLFRDYSNSLKSNMDAISQQPARSRQSKSPDFHGFLDVHCSGQMPQNTMSEEVEKFYNSRLFKIYCSTDDSIGSSSTKMLYQKSQGNDSKSCMQDGANVSRSAALKHKQISQPDSKAESMCNRKTKISGSSHDHIQKMWATSPNDAFHKESILEIDELPSLPGRQMLPIPERAGTPSPGRPSCRRLSHMVIPQQSETIIIRASSFRDVYSQHAGQMATCVEEDEEEENASPALVCLSNRAKEVVLHRCQQTEPISFSKAFPNRFWDTCRKIGEGVYGEVFLSEAEDGGVLKVIPIEGDKIINGEPQKKYEEILSEIVIAMELSELRNCAKNSTCSFSEVKKCMCVKGCYPKRLIKLWEEYDISKGSENDCPVIFENDQIYIILVLTNGGKDLEEFCFNSADQALSVFKQTACALAVAESALEFEHRDLHWGNVLIAPTSIKTISFKINGEVFDIATKGIQATIIDFTLSRMSYDGCCIFNDLARDPTLFDSEGDYQFDVYRLMRDSVRNEWQSFEPFTNVLWLHYLLNKMITMVNYRRINTKIHQKGIEEMKRLSGSILSCASSRHFVLDNIVN